jgi:hypothetical protein
MQVAVAVVSMANLAFLVGLLDQVKREVAAALQNKAALRYPETMA